MIADFFSKMVSFYLFVYCLLIYKNGVIYTQAAIQMSLILFHLNFIFISKFSFVLYLFILF